MYISGRVMKKRLSFGATALTMIIFFLLFLALATWISVILSWPRSINWIFVLFFGLCLLEIISRFGPKPFRTFIDVIRELAVRDRIIFLSSIVVGVAIAIYLGYRLTTQNDYVFWIPSVVFIILTFAPIRFFGTPEGKQAILIGKGKNVKLN